MLLRYLIIIFGFVCSSFSYAGWLDSNILISESWGDEENNFGIRKGDVRDFDVLPGPYDVSREGNIVMADKVNGRFKIYNANKELSQIVVPPVVKPSRWFIAPAFIGENVSLILDKFYIYSIEGELVAEETVVPNYTVFKREINDKLFVHQKSPLRSSKSINQWAEYTSLGTLVSSYSQKPLVLGRVFEDTFIYNGQKKHRLDIDFDDAFFSVVGRVSSLCENFDRDKLGNLYCVKDTKVTRFNACGKPVSELELPEDQVSINTTYPDDLGVPNEEIINSKYYAPSIDEDGNIYAVRRTPENYSLVKWTWQDSANDSNDGPDAPINVTLKALNTSAVELTWEGSLQDPGCVTGYQVLRSDTPGDETTVVSNPVKGAKVAVDASVEAGNTYYYTVKALSAISDSEPSAEVSITLDP